ncbi:DUF4132 domain-containing protein [Duganella sp. CF517]|uniref:DUF4132 domain-containing protein n=1 Tax=Duganella sp. CF517 TaxID=1881038 RepID=UPI001C435B96|nr:DUF4132 domain-containing protein [Duganella sp. CF517]
MSLPAIAVQCLGWLDGEAPPALAAELRRILGEPAEWTRSIHQSYALARWSDAATRAELAALVAGKYRDATYLLAEFAMLDRLSDQAVLTLGGSDWVGIYWPGAAGDREGPGDPALALAAEPAYVAFARDALRRAVLRLGQIHAGAVPYVADGAFALDDTPVIARAARVAALRDEPWFPDMIGALLPQSCVAPTAAKTAPSQSLAIALGHSVEGVPTPEAVRALRDALGVVRHAGVQKKLARNLKPAERALMERPEVALRMLASLKSGKREQAMLASCLESGYWLVTSLDMDAWRALARSAAGAPVAQALVWTLGAGDAGFMIQSTPQGLLASDSAGRPLALPDAGRVSLWHPLAADEPERAAWQALLAARRLRQPFRQVYREFYLPPTDFSGHVLAVRRLLGLARREGWRIGYDDLLRGFGALRVGFSVNGKLYPGADGYCVSTGLRFERRDGIGWRTCAPDGIAPVVFSEACRAVDLLVSTAGIGLDDDGDGAVPDELRMLHLHRLSEVKPGRMADLRRSALLQIFAPLIAAGRVAVGERDVRVGDHAVSLATGRVTRGGAPVASPARPDGPRLAALPWLPYDEVLLERIVDTVGVLAGGA